LEWAAVSGVIRRTPLLGNRSIPATRPKARIGRCAMTLFLKRSALALTAFLFLTASAWSQCNNPSSPGVVVCTPTDGSTVVYPNEISVRSTPASGASIVSFTIYANGVAIYQGGKGQSGIDLIDGAVYDGHYNMRVTARDSDGNHYQATTNFNVIGQGYAPCSVPNAPGINFCEPPPNAVNGLEIVVGAAARGEGKAAIKRINFYLNGKYVAGASDTYSVATPVTVAEQGVPNTVTVKATDADGNHFTATKKVEADYTYGQYSCSYSCPPGINVIAPQADAYVANTFNLDMQIVGNPNPITSMTAYIDHTLVASSNNANLQQEVTDAPNGTHILTVKGVDTEGIKYFYQENININVDE
jgi:hypothetical protein